MYAWMVRFRLVQVVQVGISTKFYIVLFRSCIHLFLDVSIVSESRYPYVRSLKLRVHLIRFGINGVFLSKFLPKTVIYLTFFLDLDGDSVIHSVIKKI